MTAATVKTVNYTPEQTAKMVAEYVAAPSAATVETIALALGKTVRSVVAKLSREKVYVAKEYKTKTGEKVQKKDAVADAIGAVLKMSEPEIESLTKVNKTALLKVWAIVAKSVAPAVEAMDTEDMDERDEEDFEGYETE